MELKICHLYPDVLNLYGDRGNILCMEKRLQWRGIDVVTTGVGLGDKLNAADFDLFMIGGSHDFDQDNIRTDLADGKAGEIIAAIEDGKTFLAIDGGFQMLGRYYQTPEGEKREYIGALDVYTVGGKVRKTGNYVFSVDELPGITVVGFENHAARTYLGDSAKSLGRIISGFGNNGEDGTEGARYKNVFASYGHGCLLPKNPELTDYILTTALEQKYAKAELLPLDDTFEKAAHAYMVNSLEK